MNRKDALIFATKTLQDAGIENADREARLLVTYALRCEALELIIKPNIELSPDEETLFQQWLKRRAAREPLARIHGLREFWGLPFGMNEATLEPRPDTETLVEYVLNLYADKDVRLRILDIGTGTGCILLSLLHEFQNATGIGTDASKRALEAAKHNAIQLGLKTRVDFIETNWCDGITGTFDIITSNPPYISKNELDDLQPEVKLYDPMLALNGGADGLDPYRAIAPAAKILLKKKGMLVFEVGHTQASAVADILKTHGFENITTKADLQGIARVVAGVL